MTTPLGAFARTPLGAFTTTPLGARGAAAVQPPVGLYTCTIVAQVGTATDQAFAYLSSDPAENGTACGDQAGPASPGLGANNVSEIRAESPVPIGGAPPFSDLFDEPATLFWRSWSVTGDTSGTTMVFSDIAATFTCTQREPIDIRTADTLYGGSRIPTTDGSFLLGVPEISQTFKLQPGQFTGIGTWWNLLATPTLPYPFINGESGVISGVLPS